MMQILRNLFNRNNDKKDDNKISATISDSLFKNTVTSTRTNISAQTTDYQDNKTTFSELRKKDKQYQLRTLARISPNVSRAVDIVKTFTNSGITLNGDTKSVESIQSWLDDMLLKGITLDNLLDGNIIDLYTLGYFAIQNIGDENNIIVAIRNIDPDYIAFEFMYDDHYKWYEAVGYYKQDSSSKLRSPIKNKRNFKPLQSIIHNEPNFYYAALQPMSGRMKGASIIESVIDLAISEGEKEKMQADWLKGNVFPGEVIYTDVRKHLDLVLNNQLSYESVTELAESTVEELKKLEDDKNSSQTFIFTDVPVERVPIGPLEGGLRALQVINDSHKSNFPKALKVPPLLLNSSDNSAALIDTGNVHEILTLYKLVLSIRNTITLGYNKLFRAKLDELGDSGTVTLEFNSEDPEFKAAMNKALLDESQAAKIHEEMGTFTIDEIRQAFTEGHLDFTKFDSERPVVDEKNEDNKKDNEEEVD